MAQMHDVDGRKRAYSCGIKRCSGACSTPEMIKITGARIGMRKRAQPQAVISKETCGMAHTYTAALQEGGCHDHELRVSHVTRCVTSARHMA